MLPARARNASPSLPRLVFVARFPPWPATSGAPIRMHRLLTGLAAVFDVTLVAHARGRGGSGPGGDPAELSPALPGVRYVPVPARPGSKRAAQLVSLSGRRSHGYGRYATPALRQAVLAAARGADLVHFDDPGSAMSGRVPGALNVVAPHDIESVITLGARAGAGAGAGWARRAFASIDGRKQAREERTVCRQMDLCVAVSELDAAHLRAAGARQVAICPNGTDPVPWLGVPRRARDETVRLLFVGNGEFQPNARGLQWLIEDVLPRLPASAPAVLDVVGRPPARPLRSPGVRYHGEVPDVRPHYERAHIAVAPIPFGSGTRLKIVEAMAHGRPVVSTGAGAEGLPAQPGRHYLEGDSAPDFAAALTRLSQALIGGDLWVAGMMRAARLVAERLFWPSIASDLADCYLAAIDGQAAVEVRRA
jgi:glycosyltransferase involved in cell wall biosynthesis